MRTLILARHAKSDYPAGVADHDRPLSPRGRRDAPVAGQWVADNVGGPEQALVSTALRAQETWTAIAAAIPGTPQHDEPRIYEASPGQLLRVIAEIPADVKSVIIVGHNPGLEELAERLSSSSPSSDRDRLVEKYPTSAVAVFRTEQDWAHVVTAELVAFAVPRG